MWGGRPSVNFMSMLRVPKPCFGCPSAGSPKHRWEPGPMVISWRRATPKEPTPAHPGAPRLPLFGGEAAGPRLHDCTHGTEETGRAGRHEATNNTGTKPQHLHRLTGQYGYVFSREQRRTRPPTFKIEGAPGGSMLKAHTQNRFRFEGAPEHKIQKGPCTQGRHEAKDKCLDR